MKFRFLPVCLSLALPWFAMEGGAAQPAGTPELAYLHGDHDRLPQLLDDMMKTCDADFSSASSYMLELTGDTLSFVRRMEELSAAGHPVAMAWKAIRLSPEEGDEAFRLLSAAAAEYRPAIVWLAELIYRGWKGRPGDEAEAKVVLMAACKTGDAKARALYLKWGHLQGPVVDCAGAELSSEIKRHNYYLAEYLAECPGLEQDWLKEASEHGSPDAAYAMYRNAVATEPEASVAYLRLAAQRHNPAAMAELGCMLYSSSAPGSEESQAGVELLLHSAATGNSPRAAALVALAYAYCAIGQGERFVSDAPDVVQEVADLFRFAHEHGDAIGSVGWGYCLVAGKGCKQDAAKGLEILAAAERELPRFTNLTLYHIYADGIGVEADARKAAEHEARFKSGSPALPVIWLFADRSSTAPFMPGLE